MDGVLAGFDDLWVLVTGLLCHCWLLVERQRRNDFTKSTASPILRPKTSDGSLGLSSQ